ncbi:hypothetical protein [Ensifer sp. 4252]|uniref:hypothetical protein n=1 Tax=Ensifer sp. 4252 TaxID=3373915 RepID=UPI003D1A53F8
MSDERDFYMDGKAFNELAMNWEMASSLCFSDDDLFKRRIADAHPIVREKALEWYDDEDTVLHYLYAPAEKVRRRMEVQGYTAKRCRALWEREYASHIAHAEEHFAGRSPEFEQEIAAQKGLSFEEWEARESRGGLEQAIKWGGLHLFSFTDMFAALAIAIDVYNPEAIWTDFTSIYDFDPDLTLHANLARQPSDLDLDFIEPTGTVLILTEGASDTKILSSALKAMYPEFADLYEFVDFEEFKIEGGVSMVTKTIKAFAGVRMAQRTIGLFDNDAAGWEQAVILDRLPKLPPSIRTMLLPDVEIGRSYPTMGPEGLRDMDVNGSACSIELFLGREALSDENGNLRPIRWSSWNKAANRYQGELENKNAATIHFVNVMKAGGDPMALRAAFPEMDGLLNALFRAFH